MPLEQTITIVNNSGKIISTGKQLVSIFKEAKASYQDKKAQIKAGKQIARSQTFDASRSVYRNDPSRSRLDRREYYEDDEGYDGFDEGVDEYGHYRHGAGVRRRYSHDQQSQSSGKMTRRTKSVYSKRNDKHSHSHKSSRHSKPRPALTESNIKALTEVNSTTPSSSKPHPPYRSPYAETLPFETALSRMDLHGKPFPSYDQQYAMDIPRTYSTPQLPPRPSKDIDMDLAYGNIPPDLESRFDLDPAYQALTKESRAKALVRKVEGLLDEAECVQHSAGAIISHLQENPDAAAAVALTLAELSSLVSKMSPAFLGLLKGGSPAVFSLLASPQFLIGTGVVVGVTIVMFGGWKIVKKVKDSQLAREAIALQSAPLNRPATLRTQSEFSTGIDEAVVLDEELSTIESWRRGIVPSIADDESADMELITPEAKRAKSRIDEDLRSKRSVRTAKSTRTNKTSKTNASTHKTSSRHHTDVPERGSSKHATDSRSTSHKKPSSSSHKKKQMKAIEDGKSVRDADEEALEMMIRPKMGLQTESMLKAMFKGKKDRDERDKEKKRERVRSQELVLAR